MPRASLTAVRFVDQRGLKVPDVISMLRPRGGLAFLSTCRTTTGHGKLSDEAIHTAAGPLFAGYGGIIGTMRSVGDSVVLLVVKGIYEHLFCNITTPDYQEAARALHKTMSGLRDSKSSFVKWLLFIHVGL